MNKSDAPIATIIPQSSPGDCERTDCLRTANLVQVIPDRPDKDTKTLCGDHLPEYLQEVAR